MISPVFSFDLVVQRYRHPRWKKTAPWIILVDLDRNVWLDTEESYGWHNISFIGRFAPNLSLPVSPGWNKGKYKITKANVLEFAGC